MHEDPQSSARPPADELTGVAPAAKRQRTAAARQAILAASTRHISLHELAQHSTRNDCWVAIRGQVFDVTNFVPEHPAGAGPILQRAGKDATSDFEEAYPASAFNWVQQYCVGSLAPAEAIQSRAGPVAGTAQPMQEDSVATANAGVVPECVLRPGLGKVEPC
jgi:cytochrome b involved in lipid metabolism